MMASIGPSLPPHLQKSRSAALDSDQDEKEDQAEEDDQEDSFGPALPPHLAAARHKKASPPAPFTAEAGPSRPRVVGPAAPPSSSTSTRITDPAPNPYGDDEDEEDDYEVGPSLSGAVGYGAPKRSAAEEFMEREARWANQREEAAKPKEMKREEWMLVPPKNSTLAETLKDPLKIKARGFARSAEDVPRERDQTLWTETPAQRQQRLQDELTGKKRKLENSNDDEDDLDDAKKRRRDAQIQASVQMHNSRHRANPMIDIHSTSSSSTKANTPNSSSGKPKNNNDDEPPPVIWDRDLHMGVTGRLMGDKDRAKMLKDAKNLGDRFGKGSYA